MALIKCSECGQMVSDKATACPHCGCPIEEPVTCPECGADIAEGDSFCQKCGYSLNSNTQPSTSQVQEAEQLDYSWDDDEEKSNGKKRWLLLALAALLVAGGVAGWYYWRQNQFIPQTEDDEVLIDMTSLGMEAPGIGLNADGMYSIEDCPTTYEGLEIEPHIASNGTLMSVVVKQNGEQTQVFNVNSSLFENVTNSVHFLDANFDGYVDFMVGNGECEQSSALFLWSPDDSKFVQALLDGNLSFSDGCRGFSFRPQTKKVYCDGYSDTDIQYLMSWVENDLRAEEEFIQTFSPSMYYDNINHRYTIRNHKTQKVIFSSDDPKQIPERWKKMARILTPEEESEYAEWDNSSYEEDGGNDPSSSSMRDNDGSSELDDIRAQLERERSQFSVYFEQFRSLMQQYGTSSPDPYVYDNLMGSLNRMIEIADRGEKLANQLGNTNQAKWFRSQAKECRNGKNQLIYQH